jgi:hypothetical protein
MQFTTRIWLNDQVIHYRTLWYIGVAYRAKHLAILVADIVHVHAFLIAHTSGA